MSQLTQDPNAPEGTLQEGQGEGAGQETGQASEQPAQINLDEDPRFRKHKSVMDQKLAERDRQIDQLQAQLEELQGRADELALRDATPEEREKYLQNKITQLQEERKLEAQQRERMTKANAKAVELLAKHGLTMDTPGINFNVDPTTYEGWQEFSLSVADVVSRRSQMTQEQVEAEVREAKQKAIKETGALKVSTATGTGSTDDALWAAYRKELEPLRGTGDFGAWAAVRKKYRAKGLPI